MVHNVKSLTWEPLMEIRKHKNDPKLSIFSQIYLLVVTPEPLETLIIKWTTSGEPPIGTKSHKDSKWVYSWAVLLVNNWLPPCRWLVNTHHEWYRYHSCFKIHRLESIVCKTETHGKISLAGKLENLNEFNQILNTPNFLSRHT